MAPAEPQQRPTTMLRAAADDDALAPELDNARASEHAENNADGVAPRRSAGAGGALRAGGHGAFGGYHAVLAGRSRAPPEAFFPVFNKRVERAWLHLSSLLPQAEWLQAARSACSAYAELRVAACALRGDAISRTPSGRRRRLSRDSSVQVGGDGAARKVTRSV